MQIDSQETLIKGLLSIHIENTEPDATLKERTAQKGQPTRFTLIKSNYH